MPKHPDPTSHLNRRQFLRRVGAASAAFSLASSTFSAQRLSPNEKINLAGIGIGGRGGVDVDEVAAEGHDFVALCDVDTEYAGKMFVKYPNARQFTDYRVMLDKMGKEIDAVVIGTPDHTHAVIAREAIRRGKHVYCEKPLAHNIYEVRALMAAANKYKVVTQLGNQGHSTGTIRQLCEWVWAGAVGKVHTVHAACDAFKDMYCQIPNLPKMNEHHDAPKELDYDLWVGPVPFRPYSPLWVPVKWRGWMHFGTGTIGDWYCHVLDPSFWALGLNAPDSIHAEVTGYDVKLHSETYPPASKITFQFPATKDRGAVTVVWHDGNETIPRPERFSSEDKVPGTGAILFGEKGMIVHGSHGAGACYITPQELMDEHSGKNAPPQTIPRVKGHHWDWLEAIRTGRQAGSNFDYGGPLTQAALLGAIAVRFPGQTLQWDDKKASFTNNKEANAFVHLPYREGWKL
jgi:predicted dehydrogenase